MGHGLYAERPVDGRVTAIALWSRHHISDLEIELTLILYLITDLFSNAFVSGYLFVMCMLAVHDIYAICSVKEDIEVIGRNVEDVKYNLGRIYYNNHQIGHVLAIYKRFFDEIYGGKINLSFTILEK